MSGQQRERHPGYNKYRGMKLDWNAKKHPCAHYDLFSSGLQPQCLSKSLLPVFGVLRLPCSTQTQTRSILRTRHAIFTTSLLQRLQAWRFWVQMQARCYLQGRSVDCDRTTSRRALAGVGAHSTTQTFEFISDAATAGANSVLVLPNAYFGM